MWYGLIWFNSAGMEEEFEWLGEAVPKKKKKPRTDINFLSHAKVKLCRINLLVPKRSCAFSGERFPVVPGELLTNPFLVYDSWGHSAGRGILIDRGLFGWLVFVSQSFCSTETK